MGRVNIKFYFDNEFEIWKEFGQSEMEQDPMVLPAMSSTCLLSVENLQPKIKFNQSSEKMQK